MDYKVCVISSWDVIQRCFSFLISSDLKGLSKAAKKALVAEIFFFNA